MWRRSSIRGRRSSRAFSLLELLLVLALFGLIGTLMVGAVGTMLRDSDRNNAQEKALGAIAKARHQSVLAGEPIDLRYDEKSRQLDWGHGTDVLADGDGLRLLPVSRIASMLVGGRLVERPLEHVRFYPDGTCDPFRIEIVRENASRFLTIDPWTCTPLSEDSMKKGRR